MTGTGTVAQNHRLLMEIKDTTTANSTGERIYYGGPLGTTGCVVTVTETPLTNGTLAFTNSTFSSSETGSTVNLTVSRTSGTSGAVSVQCAYAGTGTATSGTDFTFASPTTLNWAAGDSANKNCTITLNDDTTWEGNETANFLLQTATGGATIGAQSTTALTLTENDSVPTVQFQATTSNGSEATTPASFTVVLSNATISNVNVTYNTANGTATAGSDYTARTGQTLTIPALSTSGSITVAITDDVAVEAAETFTVTLSGPTNATLGANTVHTFTINDNESTNGSLAFTGATFSVAENGSTVNLTVSRTSGTTGAVSVECAYAGTGTATSGTDFTFASPTTLNWAAGDSANKNCTVTINDDAVYEGNETANFLLQNAGGGATIGAQSTTALTITDDESMPTVQFQTTTSNGSEGTTPASFTVVLSNATTSGVNVTYNTANGTATAGSDYTAKTGQTLFIPALSTSGTITVAITNDVAVEANETFTITLSGPAGATLGANTVHTYTINDNEVANGTIALSAATYSVGEGGGFVTITATRTAGSASAVGITYATSNGSATAGSDYTAAGSTLSWADGDAADKTFTVSISEDTIYEGSETFNVTLSAPTGGASLGGPSTAVVTITDNDTPPTVAFQTASSSGSEGTTPASFTVVLSGQTVSVVTINYATSNGTATAADFTAKSGTLTFPALTTTGSITVAIINDVVIDANENFVITLSVPVNASLGGQTTHTFTIIDNDGTPPAVPTGVTIQSIRSNSAVISWNTVTGATSYNVYRSTDGSTWGSAIGGIGTPPYTDTMAPKSNTKYYWTVTSFNGAESAYATSASGRTALSLGYNMISAPYNTAGQIPVAVFGGWADWAWFWLSTGSASPDTNGNWVWPNSVTPGQGVLAWSYNDTTVVTASGSANPAQIIVTLVPGWNLISNHQLTDMTGIGTNWLVDGASLTSKVADLTIDGALNWWDGSTYQTLLISGNPPIEPWKSYFILNNTGVNHTLTIK